MEKNNSTWRVSSDCDGHFEEKKKTIELSENNIKIVREKKKKRQ